ncbi:MAG TPA: FtsX-like permease family protein [Ktedonobacteraceae bacterium]|nr:FtsX-like permease family protein [Ktedonobacteraceae bacterium]
MARSTTPSKQRGSKPRIPPTMMLAFWRLRQSWRLLLITGIGIIAAVMFVCSVPLYSDVTMSAGLRDALTSSTQSADVVVQSTSDNLDAQHIGQASQELDQLFQKNLGAYLNPVQLSIQTGQFPILGSPACPGFTPTTPARTCDDIKFISSPTQQSAPHITFVAGRMPAKASGDIEVALTTESATQLHKAVGSIILTSIAFNLIPPSYTNEPPKRTVVTVPLHLVGIFNPPAIDNPYWHSLSFLSASHGFHVAGNAYTGLVSTEGYLAYFNQLAVQPQLQGLNLEIPVTLNWYYSFNAPHIAIYNLDDMINGVSNVQVTVGNSGTFNAPPYLGSTKTVLPSSVLQQFQARVPVAQVPTGGLLFLVLGLVLFFVTMMSDLLVDRQSDAIAVLRSRGASRSQIFGSFVTQSLGLGIIALILGPLLAILVVTLMGSLLLSSADRGALNIIMTNTLQILSRLSLYAVATAIVAVVAMVIAVSRSTSLDILSMRRESARSARLAVWQRLNLDVVAAIIAIIGYGVSAYITNSSLLDIQLRLLLVSPLTLLGIVFLLIAGILLFLRVFPFLLQLGSSLATRNRGAAPMLAMAQMARAPRQSIRMTLLLTLATIFTMFALVFIASQTQRVPTVAAFESGADFSGPTVSSSFGPPDFNSLTAQYNHIPGVISASVGYTALANDGGGVLGNPLELRAVDADSFARTAIWSVQDSSQSLSDLMHSLVSQRQNGIQNSYVPAYVDQATWQGLHLSLNQHFTLVFNDDTVYNGSVDFVALGEVQSIPTIADSTQAINTTDFVPSGGILADYKTFSTVYINDFKFMGATVPINYVWVRTKGDAASVANVRQVLGNANGCCLQLNPLNDRRAMIAGMQNDPIYLDLIGLLAIGAATTILLALIGNLIASWLSARGRLTSFVVLRALGAAPDQVARVLTWEQVIIYATGIILGTVGGILLSLLVLPSLIYTGVGLSGNTTSGQFYLIQTTPPIQIVLPLTLFIVIAALIVICVIALAMMVRVVSKPSINQTLRLNED